MERKPREGGTLTLQFCWKWWAKCFTKDIGTSMNGQQKLPAESPQPQSGAGEGNPVPLVELRQVSKRFGSTVVLDHVDLKVYRGEAVGLVGPSGTCLLYTSPSPRDS